MRGGQLGNNTTTTSPQPARLAEVRELLEKATRTTEHLAQPTKRAGPTERVPTLPVAAALAGLLPDGGLRKGSTLAVGGSTALLLGLIAEASARGSWSALVGLPEVGLVAAAEAGVELGRLALVPDPGDQLVAVVAALVEGLDVVVVGCGRRIAAGARARLTAKARQSGAVLISHGWAWPGADLEVDLVQRPGQWKGLCGGGHGRLRARQVQVRVGGRGGAHRPRTAAMLLPGPDGVVSGLDPAARSSDTTLTARPVAARQAG
jgi:hypothetical protein